MATNPFLMDGFDTGRTNDSSIFNNPFAVGGADNSASSAASSNPFLSATADTSSDTTSTTYTNPFAQFLMGGAVSAPASSSTSPFGVQQPAAEPSTNNADLIFCDVTPQPAPPVGGGRRRSSSGYNSDSGKRSPPRRPPPPRVGPPPVPPASTIPFTPPKATQDLILSVTGALEATSTDLLDRLQATRTPSPTPLRDLASPSPTNMEVNDLMGDDDIQVPRMAHNAPHATNMHQEAMNIFDAIANLSREQESGKTDFTHIPTPPAPTPATIPSPGPPPMPSRPPPPQIPPLGSQPGSVRESPYTSRKSSLVSETSRRSSTDFAAPPLPRPPPPTLVEPRQLSTEMPLADIISGETAPSSTFLTDKRDMPGANYVSTRKTSHDITATRMQNQVPLRKKFSLDYSSAFGEQAVIKEQLDQYSGVMAPSVQPEGINNSSSSSHAVDNAPILETPKFPAVISTTPIMSYENIANENLYSEHIPAAAAAAEKVEEPGLIFDEAVEKPAIIKDKFRPATRDTFTVSTPDPFSGSTISNKAATKSDLYVSDMNATPPAADQPRDDFDAFEEKFDSFGGWEAKPVISSSNAFDPFGDAGVKEAAASDEDFATDGFGTEAPFDEFLAASAPFGGASAENIQYSRSDQQWPNVAPAATNVYRDNSDWGAFPSQPKQVAPMAPPTSFNDTFNTSRVTKADSMETPATPLFDEDISQPLEPFPRTGYTGTGWEMHIRYPIRKKFTGQRFWKKVFVRLVYQGETPHLEVLTKDEHKGKETLLHEWPLQPCYAISDIGAQQYDQYGKIFTVKIQFIVYKERPGVRPGQVTKAERLTNKLSQFAAYAIQGDYQGVKEFGSDLKKLGLPVEHSPQISLICKLGSHNYEDMKQFSSNVEDALFRLSVHRDNIHINYKMEEVQITAVDEIYVEQNSSGSILKQIARVRLFFLGFVTGMPDIEIGVNDLRRQGKEVVGRHDIIPVVTEEWIRLENVEFHSCIQQEVWEDTKTIKFKPPDQCYLELMRFRVRPPKNRELPLQVKTVFRICGNKVDIYSDILVPGFTSRKLGQIPCEDVAVRIPIPECWIYLFRTEKHFRYGSVKSAHRRTGKVKGIERFLGAIDTLETHLIEVTSGHAKYEHHHRSIVWRMSRLPKEGQGAYTTHNLVCHLALTSYDQVPEELAKHCFVEFTMPITQVSHTTVRSVSICNSDSDAPPEKYVRHLARHEYRVEIEHTHSETTNEYLAATMSKPKPPEPARPSPAAKQPLESVPDSDEESD